MKIRQGFVSNSSSSNFISIGILVENFSKNDFLKKITNIKEEELEKMDVHEISDMLYETLDETEYTLKGDSEEGFEPPKGYIFICKEIVKTDSDDLYLDQGDYTLDEIIKIGQEIKDKFNIDGEIKLVYGTKSC